MLQTQLPIFPDEVANIMPELAFKKEDGISSIFFAMQNESKKGGTVFTVFQSCPVILLISYLLLSCLHKVSIVMYIAYSNI